MGKIECKISVGVLLKKGNKVLLSKRRNTGFCDGNFDVVAGHVEENESLKQAMIREAKEEVGITLFEDDLKLINIHYGNTGEHYVNFFFLCEKYEGEEKNNEPDKCSEIRWFDMNELPENLGFISKRLLHNYKIGKLFDEYGWAD